MFPILATISLICVIVSTFVLYDRTTEMNARWKSSLDNIVDQINNNQNVIINIDKKQFQDIGMLGKSIADIKKKYVKTDDIARSVTSEKINADFVTSKNFNIGGGQYNIGRGSNKSNQNRLQINMGTENESGLDMIGTNGISKFSIDSKSGSVNAQGKIVGEGGMIINSNLIVNGTQRNQGNQTYQAGAAVYGDGRLHIAPNETLYLLPKNGVTIGKEWGGTGSLSAQGDVTIGGLLKTNGINSSNGLRVTHSDPGPLTEVNYGSDDNRYGIGQFPGGQTRMYTAGGAYVPASLNLSIAKKDGTFVDAINITKDNNLTPTTNINSSLNINGDTKINGITNTNDLYANNTKLSGNYTAYPDNRKDGSEIANDTNNFKQLMLVGNKSSGAERRIGMWDTVNVNGTLNVNGNQRNNGNISMQGGSVINGDGRLHISPNEILYLLPKNGVIIGKEWGGTGNLNAQGKISTNESFCINNSCLTQTQLDAIKKSANVS